MNPVNVRPLPEQYPFSPSSFLSSGGRISYLDEGKGHAVVMLHGNPTWSFLYRNAVTAFRQDFRCIVPDHLGCGLSDKPQDTGLYRLQGHIDRIQELLVDHLQLESFSLMVHDWGGAIGAGLAVRFPHRIRSLHILNTAAFRSTHIPRRIAICRNRFPGSFLIRGLNGFVRGLMLMGSCRRLPAVVQKGFLYPYHDWSSRVANHEFVLDIPLEEQHPSYRVLSEIESRLHTLKHLPIQIHWGMKDWCFTPFFLDQWMAHFPNACVTRHDNASHLLLEDAGSEILPDIRNFIQKNVQPRSSES